MKSYIIVLAAAFTVCAMLISSCNDEPEAALIHNPVQNGEIINGPVDFSCLNQLTSGKKEIVFAVCENTIYRKNSLNDGKWTIVEDQLIGYQTPTPLMLVIQDGKIYKRLRELQLSYIPGSAFATALGAVNKKLHKEYDVFASWPYSIDEREHTFSIGGTEYGILAADSKNLMLSFLSNYTSSTGDGQILHISTYRPAADLKVGKGDNLAFDSVVEAYDWLIETFRNTFGEKVDLNKLYPVILDQPYFYLSGLEKERERFLK